MATLSETLPGLKAMACLAVALLMHPVASEGQVAVGADPNPVATPSDPGMPYVYTNWKHLTVAEGLPNDHVFAVKATDSKVWIGTENGLACYDKKTQQIQSWQEEEGLPWRVVSALEIDPSTGDLWIGLFGGGLARFSGGHFEHWNQLNSGLVNDVVYGVAIENGNVWAATTAGASRYNTETGQWTIFNEKNAPMEEIWNYGVSTGNGKVYLGVWGSGVLEYDLATEQWKDYLDPDGEMEIDLYRDDGIVHVITTGTSSADGILWVSTYFGMSRYDGRNWRGYYAHETGLPSDFGNAVKGRSANEAWYATDRGVGVVTDFATDTWVTYTQDPATHGGKAVVKRGSEVVAEISLDRCLPHNYTLCVDFNGNDAWVGTSKGLAWAVGDDYYVGLKKTAKESK
ncbi:ligand-binding sensor domain-containing protein [Novipirellula artificiosorum]|uniref:Two component regulator propeller n=1 Tax=Novipirellula artificiosorum TaxID=2528016 RepID=A0A5C6DJC1_9BACT|nr:regulator [Novipirellula artificiosorum]TWU35997.1 hypothetical protein Poly41_37490 [Novipirellula artificiosorum]